MAAISALRRLCNPVHLVQSYRLMSTIDRLARQQSSSRWTRWLGAGVFIAGSTAIFFNQNESARRTASFWSTAFPVYLHYRFVEKRVDNEPKHVQSAAFEELHNKYAPVMLDIILNMKGFYIKVGQIGSTRADILPQQYLDVLETLQDRVPAEPFEYVQGVIEQSWQQPLEQHVAWVDPQPLGAASIGQVHRAKLKDGREVVIKVKFPEVEKNFDSDMDTITEFCKLAQPEQVHFLREVKAQFLTEFDYTNEARNLRVVWDNLKEEFGDQITMPEPINELCTRDVLVMTYLPGRKFIDVVRDFYATVAEQQGRSLSELEDEHKEKLAKGVMEQGPSQAQMDRAIMAVRAWTACKNAAKACVNPLLYLLGYQGYEYTQPDEPLNIPRLLKLLLDVHGHQIFVDGVFNGDCHPGNLLICDDGRLGLIDLGQVSYMSDSDRYKLAEVMDALYRNDQAAVVARHAEMGYVSQKGDPYVSEKMARIGFDRDDRETCEGYNLQQFVEQLNQRDPMVSGANSAHVMASRTSILLRGLATHLSYPLVMTKEWRPWYLKALQEQQQRQKLAEVAA
eukprot:TRINITY_DN12273_c0_g1_i1.p1 TRINITY_DN12273_c0_g1~~TRINITY_DN12273_c0_g1_i1.p1  ORF type:complete len:566 (+),score=133.06 TRINITY_DN12273_c0_g1_i1:99-1796(+)